MNTSKNKFINFNSVNPIKNILLIKSHSMGVGDLLRSSAAWRALKDKWPMAKLHLLFLSKHPGYAAEELIRNHHLLSSATFVTLRHGSPDIKGMKKISYSIIKNQVFDLAANLKPELIIDFEASGLRTSFLTRIAAKACTAKTVGIAQFPGRGLFYNFSSPSTDFFAKNRGITLPIEYTNRDFVVLSALSIEREDRPIELKVSQSGILYAEKLIRTLPSNKPIFGLNIGCGTPDAINRRPKIEDLVKCIGNSVKEIPHTLLLSGAEFEREINKEFISAYANKWGDTSHIFNLAGETSMNSLSGLIDICKIFISADSGPYHMSVALKKPTLVWFNYEETAAFHEHLWCKRVLKPTPEEFANNFMELLAYKS
jgi:ADP-heptose:LPS heptosyltransferase